MAVKLRGVSTVTNVDGVAASSLTLPNHAETAEGDVLIVVTGQYTGDAGMAGMVSQGFVLIDIEDNSTNHRSRAYKKIATSSEPASYTVNFAGTTGAVNASLAVFSGAHDVLTWTVTNTGTEADAATGYDLDAARDAAAYQVYTWRNDTANSTVTWSGGTEKFDVTAKSTTAIYRGQSGVYYGPDDVADIVNAGDTFASLSADLSSVVVSGIMWNFLIADKAPENEHWDDTDGSKAVEVKMDRVELDATGSITTRMALDITTLVSAFSASAETEAASRAADGLAATNWRDSATAAPQFLTYDFGASYGPKAKRYRITSAATGSSGSTDMDPMDWTVEGSANGSSWTVLDTRTNESFGNRGDTREFRIADPGEYRYYKLNISANWSSGSTTGSQIAEWRLSTVDVWEDITTYVNYEDKIRITRGLQGTSGRSDYSRAYFTVNNTDGRFSLRNPNGAYHGGIKRNSECRISKAFGDTGLQMQGAVQVAGSDIVGDCFRTPLTYAMQITSGIDIRLDLELEAWHDLQSLAAVGPDTDDPESGWAFTIDADAKLHFEFVDTSDVIYEAVSTVAVPEVNRQSLRVDYDGSTGFTTFYTATTFNGTWVQLGAVVEIDTAANAIAYNGGSLSIGQTGSGSPHGPHGTVYNFELRDTVGATTVADLDFTAIPNGSRSYTDADDQLWIAVNYAVISNRRYRFHGEISSWPTAWDPTGTWVYVPITASGVQKRLERGGSTGSVMYRHHTGGIVQDPKFGNTHAEPIGYWPMEDLKESFQCASAITGKPHLEIYGTPLFEEFDNFKESSALPSLNGTKFGARITGADTDYIEARFLLDVTGDDTPTIGANWITLWGNGTLAKFQLHYGNTSEWDWHFYSEAALETGTPTHVSSAITVTTVGELMHVQVILQQDGADIDITVRAYNVAGELLGDDTQTVSSATFGRIYRVQVNDADTSRNTGIGMGHLAIYGASTTSPSFTAPINAHHYETAADRVKRICDEEGIQFRLVGDRDSSAFMGYQTPQSAQDIMSSAAVSDSGYLVDPLDAFGIEYRTDRSIFSRSARLTLSYTGNELSNELLPVDDDSHIVNDFTASRGEAGSSRFVLTEGELSVQAPPHGVGPYSGQQSYSLAHEGQCVDIASWNVHQGTLNEERYPRIEVALENARIAASPTLTQAILTMDVGQRIDITDTPDFLPAQDIRQIVIGYEEWFDQFQHQVRFNTISERAFEVAEYNNGSRFATNGSELYQDISSSATSILVDTTSGPRWTTDPAAIPMDWDVNGELMRVTAVGRLITDNGFFDDNITGWSDTNGSLARSTVYVHYYDQAVASLEITPDGVSSFADAFSATSGVGTITPLEQYEASSWVYSPTGHTSIRMSALWYDAAGVFISSSSGTVTAVDAGTWTHLSDIFQAPATSSRAQVQVIVGDTPAAGNKTYLYSTRLVEKSEDAEGTFDSFNRANSTTNLGSTDDDLVQAWTQDVGTWGINSNAAYISAAATSVASVAGTADFERVEVTVSSWASGGAFVGFRQTDANNRCRWGGIVGAAPDLAFRVAGVVTRTEPATGYVLAAGDKLGVRCNGSVVECFINDILILTVTETDNQSGTRVGMLSTTTVPRLNDFTFRPANYPQTATVVRGVNGVTAHHPAGTPVELYQRPYRGL